MTQISLWDFSLDRYGRPGVAQACLSLQESCGADVNIVLASLWLAQHGAGIEPRDLAARTEAAGRWHRHVVRPLRAARQFIKTDRCGLGDTVETFRSGVKATELESERFEQEILAEAFRDLAGDGSDGDVATRRATARMNVDAYFAGLGVTPGEGERSAIDTLVAACIP